MSRRIEPIGDLSTYPGKYVTFAQLADYVGITRRTIYNHLNKGAIRARRVGGVLRIPIDEARAYVGHDARQFESKSA